MGKNRHSKDKLYIVRNEYQRDWGGYKPKSLSLPFRCLPFYCCGLSLLPFSIPVCSADGVVFDADYIFPYIEKYHRNPVTGAPMEKKDLIVLHFHKNHEGKFHCPVTYKEFNDHTHIVANRKSGNVYSNDAIDAICRKAKNWVDFFTNEKFSSADLITIQNPSNLNNRKIEEFDYIKTEKEIPVINKLAADEGNSGASMKKSELASQIIEESKQVEEERREQHNKLIPNIHAKKKKEEEAEGTESKEAGAKPKAKIKHRLFTTANQASSFTSTAVGISYESEFRDLTDREIRCLTYAEVKKRNLKGYARIVTDLGVLNLELHCDKAPETCDNFLRHCEAGYYNDSIFHRSIPNFMIQGGDPTGTGKGGESAFEHGAAFADEFHPHLVHKGTGVIAMANNGKNSNRSQFFITYKSCEHLNNKHTVFGKVVGGVDTLTKMEQLETHKDNDRPKHPPKILEMIVFKNPFAEVIKENEEAEIKAKEDEVKSVLLGKTTNELLDPMQNHTKRNTTETGKYINRKELKKAEQPTTTPVGSGTRKRPPDEQSSSLLEAMRKQTKSVKIGAKGDFASW